ncbi:type II toxin-antitoxin system RelE/ParE family toxin [Vibrio breoganii]
MIFWTSAAEMDRELIFERCWRKEGKYARELDNKILDVVSRLEANPTLGCSRRRGEDALVGRFMFLQQDKIVICYDVKDGDLVVLRLLPFVD